MKPFVRLTEAELLALSDDTVQRYIDYECAEAGVPLLPASAPVAPSSDAVADDLTVYEVAGILFPKREDAEKVRDLIAELEHGQFRYLSGPSYRKRYEPSSCADVAVQSQRLLSPTKAANLRAVIERAEREKKAYQDQKTEYDKTLRARNEIAEHIFAKIEEVRENQRQRDALMQEYQRYLELAAGIKSIALRFLKAARPNAEELLPDLFAPEPPACSREYALDASL